MPELPEVETLKRELSNKIKGKTIQEVSVLNKKTVAPFSVSKFNSELLGKKIISVSRRAKMLVIGLENEQFIIFHLKMTGQLIFSPQNGTLSGGGHPQKNGH